ncbi:thiolase family protein [Estrella lausannensis]|uniref:3-ketoacyl-CoA thiolase n=1 Tax=Estrella lausannensis TaxID=483423 RepID=A0A0H5DQW2_9BACT|nr:thiolase family protein [Estrella lausannensis]CRX38503.1 3-ketoacyl-CoA thiolase [Estrella lausannensis]
MERIAVVEGVRTPFCKGGGKLKDMEADDLGAFALKELIARSGIDPALIDEVIIGNVLQPPHATNIARVISVKAGVPESVPAYTVNRNCASGMEAAASAYQKMQLDMGSIFVAGGVESMSNFPVLISKQYRDWLSALGKARTIKDKLLLLLKFRPHFLAPDTPKIADPLCSMTMGETAELLSRDFKVTRKEQDEFALMSHQRASEARKAGKFKDEIVPIPLPPKFDKMLDQDDGVREGQTLADLEKLKPAFNKLTGSVTAGTSSQVTDGAAMLLLCKESELQKLGRKPLGYISCFTEVGLDPRRMGLGPAFAIAKLLKNSGRRLEEFDLIEINEAFAAQVVAVEKALASEEFARKQLKQDKAVGVIDRSRLNVNGGAVAIGHPLGASGARLIITLLRELKRQNKKLGLASLCIGGGQGQACILEVE